VEVELRKLSAGDGRDIYDMLQEIPRDENGFHSGCNGATYEEYQDWLAMCLRHERGEGLEEWMVPQTVYWLFADGASVGYAKLRHCLNANLRANGGHVGYVIRPSRRGEGHGKRLLGLILKEAAAMGIDRVLVTVQNGNAASLAVALGNGGVIEKVDEARHFIWVECGRSQNEEDCE